MKSFQKDLLQVKIYPTREEMGLSAAFDVAKTIRMVLKQKEYVNIVFGAAPSQDEFLESLCSQNHIDWQRVHAFHMDEYVGLPDDAPQRFGNFLKERIFNILPFRSVHYINSNNDPEKECERYAKLLQQHPLDIVCLGIGENGHIAFNDPHVADFNDPVWVKMVDMDEKCRMQQVNDGCFQSLSDVPTHAITLTIPAMTSGKYLSCVVPAKTKARAVYHTINDPISEEIPATCLRYHKHAVLYIDPDSASLLEEKEDSICVKKNEN